MAEIIRLRKGLDIKLLGAPVKELTEVGLAESYALCPDDFTGVTPKPVVKEQQTVKAGEALFIDKNHPEVKMVSPVSGEVVAVNRGARRKVMSIVVKPDAKQKYVEFGTKSVQSLSGEEVKAALLESGLFSFFRQRPYDVIANPADAPRGIFVSAFDSKPLAPDFEFVLQGNEVDFRTGLSAIAKIAPTTLSISASQTAEALIVTNQAVQLPVMRPLIAMDKVDIMDKAREIDTYETSIQPFEDCCTVFLPKHPVTKPKLERILKSESALDVEKLVDEAVNSEEIIEIYPAGSGQ